MNKYIQFTIKEKCELLPFIEQALNGISRTKAKSILSGGGVMVDKNISISNLIFFMKTMLSEVFKKDIKVRLRPGFFPCVEPGFELDISCLICGGDGCPSCKHSGWLELCPCGMIHPEVLKAGGIDPEEYTGFAFGLGMTRLAMMKYGIADIRDLNSGDLRCLSQFTQDR